MYLGINLNDVFWFDPAVPSLTQLDVVRWASKKAGGSSRNGRKTAGKRLGLKCGDGKQPIHCLISIHK